ncbi:MAG: hypothetical protein Q9217_004442 [Psora testacea]
MKRFVLTSTRESIALWERSPPAVIHGLASYDLACGRSLSTPFRNASALLLNRGPSVLLSPLTLPKLTTPPYVPSSVTLKPQHPLISSSSLRHDSHSLNGPFAKSIMSHAHASLQFTDPPLRPRASPRCSFVSSTDSRIDSQFTLDEPGTRYPSSGEQSPIRGRALERIPANKRSTSRTTVRRRLSPKITNIDIGAIRERLSSRDLTAEPDEYYDDSLLEPLPFEGFRSCSLSEELHRASTYGSSIDLSKFGGHRDTFAMFGFRRLQSISADLPPAFYDSLVQLVDFNTYKTLRLSCRSWSQAISRARQIVIPSVAKLPSDILGKIYADLEPSGFNAARHSCRAWMMASLDEKLLIQKLQAGGWWGAARLDMARYELGTRRLGVVSRDWLLSKRLATECALMSGWTGMGMEMGFDWDTSAAERGAMNGFTMTSEISFTRLGNHSHASQSGQQNSAQHLMVSGCQKYLLIPHGSVIYVYSIRAPGGNCPHEYGGFIQPVTSVVCSSRVLAVDMDTSSERYAIAVLLEGRTGLVWDIQRDLYALGYYNGSLRNALPRSWSNRICASVITLDPDLLSWSMDDAPSSSISLHCSSTPHSSMPVSSGPCSIYRNLSSSKHPPSSDAICPHRRCVAFGNPAGVELRWMDALSGQELQRWFPLFAASDFLYFLPEQRKVDSTRILRLASSTRHPAHVDQVLWNNTPNQGGSDSPGRAGVQHYQAVPLSDGYNVLFIDTATGQLCLGGDARSGQGTAQWARQYIFEGPEGVVPYRYTASAELRWGVRLVAAYRERLWLFTVPPDVFSSHGSKEKADTEQRGNVVPGTAPIRIKGMQIAKVPGLIDLAVDATEGDLTIWAFTSGGKAFTWQLAGSKRKDVVRRVVLDDGTVAVVTEGLDGDVQMHDSEGVGTSKPEYGGERCYPQTSVSLSSTARHNRRLTLDEDGDTLMYDVTYPASPQLIEDQDEGYASGSDSVRHTPSDHPGGLFAIHAPPIHGRWSENDAEWVPEYIVERGKGIEDEGVGVDLLEMTSVDFEVIGS